MNNCIFCKIANGEVSAETLYEDEKFRVILDQGPATKGHALILPKDHYAALIWCRTTGISQDRRYFIFIFT